MEVFPSHALGVPLVVLMTVAFTWSPFCSLDMYKLVIDFTNLFAKLNQNMLTSGQFHQRFKWKFFVRKCFEQLFFSYKAKTWPEKSCLKHFRTKNSRVKYWWYWHHENSDHIIEYSNYMYSWHFFNSNFNLKEKVATQIFLKCHTVTDVSKVQKCHILSDSHDYVSFEPICIHRKMHSVTF